MNNKLKIALVSAGVVAMGSMAAPQALAANQINGVHLSFFDRVAMLMGFKKNITPEARDQKIEQMKQKHDAKLNARLDQLVADGKLSEAQKTELKAKLDAINQLKFENASKTPQERKQATKQARQDLKAWAEANGISLGDIMPKRAHGQKPNGN